MPVGRDRIRLCKPDHAPPAQTVHPVQDLLASDHVRLDEPGSGQSPEAFVDHHPTEFRLDEVT